MIQLKNIIRKKTTNKANEQLAKVINFLCKNKIEFDLEPPRIFVRWQKKGIRTFLITKPYEEGKKMEKQKNIR